MDRWVGRLALITGASAGIGAATAKRLTNLGMKVVACARNLDKLKKLEQEVTAESGQGCIYTRKCDVSNTDEITGMFDWIQNELGGVDACINNAAFSYDKTLLEGTPDKWKDMLDVSVIGLCTCTNLAIQQMIAHGVDDGHIINIGSLLGHRVYSGRFKTFHFHAGVKHMVAALTEGYRQELRDLNSHIKVGLVSPTGVQTSFVNSMFEDGKASTNFSDHGAKQKVQADEIAELIVTMLEQKPHVQIHEILVRPTEQIE